MNQELKSLWEQMACLTGGEEGQVYGASIIYNVLDLISGEESLDEEGKNYVRWIKEHWNKMPQW